jgi:ComF family protein
MSLHSTFWNHFNGLISIIYPQFCAACGSALFRNENVLCLKCYAELPRTGFHSDPENEVAQLFWGRVPLRNATSFIYFNKGSRYQHILHELKYKGQQHIGLEMGKLFALELKSTPFANSDLVHPVPLHFSRHRKRGYNQSELIARGIAQVLNIPVETSLITRTVNTHTQTTKSRYERWENVKGIFRVEKPSAIMNKHIMLVDDVITTGSTIEACANSMLAINGVTISIASLAFAKLQ